MNQTVTLPNGARVLPDDRGFISGEVRISINDLMNHNISELMDMMSERLTGSPLLADFSFAVLRAEDQMIVFQVTGDVSMILETEA
jgi:hypothetical protein